VSCAKTAEPIDLPFVLWTWVGRRKHKFNRIRQMAPMCPHGRAHWRHLANTSEPSVCGGDAVLYQIPSTTCYISLDISYSGISLPIYDISYIRRKWRNSTEATRENFQCKQKTKHCSWCATELPVSSGLKSSDYAV